MKKTVIIIIIFLLNFQTQGENTPHMDFTIFDSKNKLPTDEINTIFQDQNDIILIGSDIGLLEYDGYDFNTPHWLKNTPYSNIEIFQMVSDSKGDLYMATSSGLLWYSSSKGMLNMIKPSVRLKREFTDNSISTLARDANGKIWFGGNSGIFSYNPTNDSLNSYQVVDKHWKGVVNVLTILVNSRNEVYIGTWSRGLARLNESKKQFETLYCNQQPIAQNIKVIKEDKEGNIWAGSWKEGLFILDIANWTTTKCLGHFTHNPLNPHSIAGDIILDINFDSQNHIWVGTPYGLSLLTEDYNDDYQFQNYQKEVNPGTLSNNEISSILCDRSGIIWLATHGGGINKVTYQSKEIEFYSIPTIDPLIKSQSVYSFTTNYKNQLLVSVKGLGFGVYDLKTKKYKRLSEITPYNLLEKIKLNTARCFKWENNSTLWIGTRYKGIIKINSITGQFLNLSSESGDGLFPVREVFKIISDKLGRLWVATNNGIFRIKEGQSGQFTDLEIVRYYHQKNDSKTLSENSISDLVIDNDGYLWVSTFNNGVNKSRENIFETDSLTFDAFDCNKNPELGLGSNKIISLFKDNSGNIWVGTIGKGLKLWNSKETKFQTLPVLYAMNETVVYAMIEDQKKNIWLTTNRGISRLRHVNGEYLIEQFSFGDGLQGNVFIKGAIFMDSEGYLYFGGHNGFNRINPDKIRTEQFIPKVIITSIKIDDHHQNIVRNNPQQPLILNYTDRYFTINFSSLDFLNPEQNKYAYMLDGLDQTWHYSNANARTATFGNLNPGKYKFMVKGTNSHGMWNQEPTVIFIEVKTAPYKTWWAITGYLLIIGGLTYLFMSLRIKNIQIQKSLELENIKRTKLENLTQFKLQFFTNFSHELLTPLSILKILSEREISSKNSKDFKDILERNVNRLHTLINQILQFRKAETGNTKIIAQELNIVPFIQTICFNYNLLAEKKNIHFQLNQPDKLVGWIDPEKIEIILNNLISNAFKYTLDNGTIEVNVSTNEEQNLRWLNLSVKDTGIGISRGNLPNIFDRFYRIGKFDIQQKGIGIGLALTKNLVTLHGGTIMIESEPGKGTQFIIMLPISSEFYQDREIHQTTPIIDPEKIISNKDAENSHPKLILTDCKDMIILLVEDEDDYRRLLKEDLKAFFKVIDCSNAQEALVIAQKQQIDIIVSDLNLPNMNGDEFCQTIKNDIKTSHIPFILITAFPADKERLRSYESGVDSFLSKPLDIKTLYFRIKSLLKKREEFQQKFTKDAFLEPQNFAITSLDEKIIGKARNIIENNIANPDLSVKTLCDELGMTNSTLYRKMKGILNMMPNEFIRNIRLKRAAQLLEEPTFDISEAAFSTGFSDPSYFSACFKKQYGVTPSAYQKGNRVREENH